MGNMRNKSIQWPEAIVLKQRDSFTAVADNVSADFDELLLKECIDKSSLPDNILVDLYVPLAAWLVQQQNAQTLIAGINGAQGSGKSTLCLILQLIIEKGFDKRVATLSIDDLYLTRDQRNTLAETVHPLLQTRGVPGTHDLSLGLSLFEQLQSSQTDISLPRFDKSIDDRAPVEQWSPLTQPIDILLFEGWCVGSHPQHASALSQAINSLESEEDSDARWRHYVNEQLATGYQALFDQIDVLIMLKIPAMEKVFEWRVLQEQKLAASHGEQSGVMTAEQVAHFVMHYERITRTNLEEMPSRADLVLKLNDDHQIYEINARAVVS